MCHVTEHSLELNICYWKLESCVIYGKQTFMSSNTHSFRRKLYRFISPLYFLLQHPVKWTLLMERKRKYIFFLLVCVNLASILLDFPSYVFKFYFFFSVLVFQIYLLIFIHFCFSCITTFSPSIFLGRKQDDKMNVNETTSSIQIEGTQNKYLFLHITGPSTNLTPPPAPPAPRRSP